MAPRGRERPAFPEDSEVYVPSPFVVRARVAALSWPLVLLATGLPQTEVLAGRGAELSEVAVGVVLVTLGLPTLPLFAALGSDSDVLVLVLAGLTCLPLWVWGGAALARRVEGRWGADWRRWLAGYAVFPLVAALAALVFVGGLAPASD